MRAGRKEPLRFIRGGHVFHIAKAYTEGETGFIGLRDGRVLARAPEASQVARLLITGL
ncbi:hypothetical protein MBEBAB_0924 [Brevundimonas abyssalis TAR-001]|uniref:Uncharacterized protein n=1 Tax=Brevundimonas abyssalis TAR-001 TaxID=1391729 RepID=A0A8E0KLA9_9CAUL|nr:hypothetical protein MBEBAB_0924 [Brevundimonas abyssalis TAR-001]